MLVCPHHYQAGQDLTSQIAFVRPLQDPTFLAHVMQGCPTLPVTELFGKIYRHFALETVLLFQSWLNWKSLPICVSFILISSAQIWRVPAYKYLLIECLENPCFLQGLDCVFESYLAMIMKDWNWTSLHRYVSHSFNQVANPHYKIKAAIQNDGYSKSRIPKWEGSQFNRDKQSFPNQNK